MAKIVCNWVNTNINLARVTGIASLHCYYEPCHLVNVYYNDGPLAEDVLEQSGKKVLTYETVSTEESWVKFNKEITHLIS